jgi:hypothetical protein
MWRHVLRIWSQNVIYCECGDKYGESGDECNEYGVKCGEYETIVVNVVNMMYV